MNKIYEKIKEENKEFVTSDDIKSYSHRFYYDYYNVIKYLTSRKLVVKIFKGIFYVKGDEEVEQNKTKYSLLELVGKALELKGIKNWYYGLYTALVLNGVISKEQKKDIYVVSDNLFRTKPLKILNYNFKFVKLKFYLTTFGIIEDVINYSDIEKTILDFVYIAKYKSVADRKIVIELRDYIEMASEKKLLEYAHHYPQSNQIIVDQIIDLQKTNHQSN